MADPLTDDELMTALHATSGSRRDEHFRELVARHANAVQGLVRAVLGRNEGVEDVTQEVFLRVYQARERYVPGRAAFRAWLLRIARNQALNARRDRSRRRASALDEEEDVVSTHPAPASVLEARLDADSLRAAIAELPTSERELITLRFQGGLSYEEIQAVTGGGTAALKQKAYRALNRLRSLLGAEGGSS